jgi:PadR family transcriptional regulator, regulatory protein PadR
MINSQASQPTDKESADDNENAPLSEDHLSHLDVSVDLKDDLEDLPSISALEEDILTALLGGYALYGLQICRAIDESSGGKQILKIGSLYPSLHRLETKGLVTSWMSEQGTEKRGGNRRKYYKMTMRGMGALSAKRKMRARLATWGEHLAPA